MRVLHPLRVAILQSIKRGQTVRVRDGHQILARQRIFTLLTLLFVHLVEQYLANSIRNFLIEEFRTTGGNGATRRRSNSRRNAPKRLKRDASGLFTSTGTVLSPLLSAAH